MTTNDRRWWHLSPEEQKREIEAELESYLDREGDLTDRQKMLIRDAIGHTLRGLFGLAVHDISCLELPEDKGPPVDASTIQGVDRVMLRSALRSLKGRPPQWPPVFT
jgi:hypothetical protein